MNTPIDLITIVERDLGPGKKSGRWMRFHCPFPGHKHGDRNPSLVVTNGDPSRPPFWKCFSCSKQGNAVKWVMEFRGVSYKDACQFLKLPPPDRGHRPSFEPPVQQPDIPPGEIWQARAQLLIKRAVDVLWSSQGAGARAWLRARGLMDETIHKARLGYIPKDFIDAPKAWGIENKKTSLFLPAQSILIPGLVAGKVWYLKRRKLHPRDDKDRYGPQVDGGKVALYGADRIAPDRPAVFCEGEFDALLLQQEIGDLASVITLGGASGRLNLATWGLYLMRPSSFLLAYDVDRAGVEGQDKLAWLHNSQRLKIPQLQPGDKDLTDFHKSGGNLRSLIENALNPETPIVVTWPADARPATVPGQYVQFPDGRIEAYYTPEQLDYCLGVLRAAPINEVPI
jgi:DNA primase